MEQEGGDLLFGTVAVGLSPAQDPRMGHKEFSEEGEDFPSSCPHWPQGARLLAPLPFQVCTLIPMAKWEVDLLSWSSQECPSLGTRSPTSWESLRSWTTRGNWSPFQQVPPGMWQLQRSLRADSRRYLEQAEC